MAPTRRHRTRRRRRSRSRRARRGRCRRGRRRHRTRRRRRSRSRRARRGRCRRGRRRHRTRWRGRSRSRRTRRTGSRARWSRCRDLVVEGVIEAEPPVLGAFCILALLLAVSLAEPAGAVEAARLRSARTCRAGAGGAGVWCRRFGLRLGRGGLVRLPGARSRGGSSRFAWWLRSLNFHGFNLPVGRQAIRIEARSAWDLTSIETSGRGTIRPVTAVFPESRASHDASETQGTRRLNPAAE